MIRITAFVAILSSLIALPCAANETRVAIDVSQIPEGYNCAQHDHAMTRTVCRYRLHTAAKQLLTNALSHYELVPAAQADLIAKLEVTDFRVIADAAAPSEPATGLLRYRFTLRDRAGHTLRDFQEELSWDASGSSLVSDSTGSDDPVLKALTEAATHVSEQIPRNAHLASTR